jgi:hypothetical protein
MEAKKAANRGTPEAFSTKESAKKVGDKLTTS